MIELNVYEKDGKTVSKTVKAEPIEIMFGTIRSLVALFKVDELENTAQILKTVTKAWDEVIDVLGECFPDMEDDDWNHTKLKDIVYVVVSILRGSLSDILSIPKEKNGKRE